MINNLAEDVLDRLLAANVDDASVDLVLAALEGEHALDAAVDGSETPARPDPTAPRTTPTGAFLTRLVVRGFRGIGEEAVLTLPPGPGLTVVAGRNGSGKSSFSEALECALTGTTGRWSRKVGHADLRTGWRNLHHPEPSEIALALDQAGTGQATIRMAWAPARTTSACLAGAIRSPARTASSWRSAGKRPCRTTGPSSRTTTPASC